MIDPFLILSPIVLLGIVALLRFVGCTYQPGQAPEPPTPTPTIAEVGGGTQRATARTNVAVGSLACAYPASVTAGSLLIAAGGVDTNPASVTVTDTLGTSYTVLLSPAITGGNKYFIAYGVAPSSGPNTITVAPSVTAFLSFAIDEFSGVDQTMPLDVDGGAFTGTSTAPAATLTTVAVNALLIGVVGHSEATTPPTITPGASYTQIGEEEDQTTFMAYNTVFRLVTTAGPYTVDWTLSASHEWLAKTAAFRPAPL